MTLSEELAFLSIQKLAVHQLPHEDDKNGVLSEVETPLLDNVRKFFEERVKDTLRSDGMAIEIVADHESPVPSQVQALLASRDEDEAEDEDPFMSASQTIAKRLFKLQSQTQSEGLICIALCKLRKQRAVAIVKLEKEEGVTANLVGVKGQTHFDIVLNDIMLSSKTRVFKVGLFVDRGTKGIEARASDSQFGHGKFAAYFLDGFLGCRLVTQPNLATQRFVTATENFINHAVTSPEKKATYHIALLAELQSKRKNINTNNFANENIDGGDDRKAFKEYLKKHDVPTPTFTKELNLVQAKVGRVQLSFDTRTVVLAPPEEINESVKISTRKDGRTHVEIDGTLQKVNGKK